MTDIAKSLGQVAPAAATATKLYTGITAGGTVGTIVVNNRNASPSVIGIEIRIGGAVTSSKDFKWEAVIAQYDPKPFTLALGNTDEVWVTADATLVNFNMDGFEL